MEDLSAKSIVLDSIEESSGKRPCHSLIEASLTRPDASSDRRDSLAPRPAFVNVFSQVAPFADGLRNAGLLDKYDYTRLRMTCKTTAQVLKPYPYNPVEPDTKDPYFAGLQAIRCDGCGIPSDKLVVKPCSGQGSQNTSGFSGCEKVVCTYCVMFAQLKFDQHRILDNEIHYCHPCSERFHQGRTEVEALKRCPCGSKNRADVVDQPYSEWQCFDCRSELSKMLYITARHNLMTLEAQRRVFPRDYSKDPFAGRLERWINPYSDARNNCPGCGLDYLELVYSWQDSELDDDLRWPRDMVRQCMLCLEQKP